MQDHDKPYCVYVYRDPRPGKKRAPIYVGAGLARSRPDSHWKSTSHNPQLAEIIAELKSAGLKPIIEIVDLFDNREEALRREKVLIAEFKGTLCNVVEAAVGESEYVSSGALSDALKVAEQYFGQPRISGNHYIFKTPWPRDPHINFQKTESGNGMRYQVRRLLVAIDLLLFQKAA